jgi:hypothetical protein
VNYVEPFRTSALGSAITLAESARDANSHFLRMDIIAKLIKAGATVTLMSGLDLWPRVEELEKKFPRYLSSD